MYQRRPRRLSRPARTRWFRNYRCDRAVRTGFVIVTPELYLRTLRVLRFYRPGSSRGWIRTAIGFVSYGSAMGAPRVHSSVKTAMNFSSPDSPRRSNPRRHHVVSLPRAAMSTLDWASGGARPAADRRSSPGWTAALKDGARQGVLISPLAACRILSQQTNAPSSPNHDRRANAGITLTACLFATDSCLHHDTIMTCHSRTCCTPQKPPPRADETSVASSDVAWIIKLSVRLTHSRARANPEQLFRRCRPVSWPIALRRHIEPYPC